MCYNLGVTFGERPRERNTMKEELIIEILQSMKSDIQGIKDDIQGMKDDMQGMKDDMQGMKDDMQGMKADIQGIKADIQDMKVEIKDLSARMDTLEENQKATNLIIENKILPSISIIAENHLNLSEKLNAALAVKEKADFSGVQIMVLEHKVDNIRVELDMLKEKVEASA